jgi:hypothetical protein
MPVSESEPWTDLKTVPSETTGISLYLSGTRGGDCSNQIVGKNFVIQNTDFHFRIRRSVSMKSKFWVFLTLLVVLSMALASCQPAAQPTASPLRRPTPRQQPAVEEPAAD